MSLDFLGLPGFRFRPTDEELVNFYLERKLEGKLDIPPSLINDIDFYSYVPWELSEMFATGNSEYHYFFVPRDRKYPNGLRPNRVVSGYGYWKATGTDKKLICSGRFIGLKKTLVFYKGRAPQGTRTNWIMNEFRAAHTDMPDSKPKVDVTLCRMYRKVKGLRKETFQNNNNSSSDDIISSEVNSGDFDRMFDWIFKVDLEEVESTEKAQIEF